MTRHQRDWTSEIDAIVALLRTYYLDAPVADRVAQVLLRSNRSGEYREHTDEP